MPLPTPLELTRLRWDDWPTRHVFFTGKGGVGKTTTASGVGVGLAGAGLRTLLISTDPASNLEDVFGVRAAAEPQAVAAVPGLWIANIDPEEAAAAYRERTVAPYRGVLPDFAVARMEEELSGACTVEIAAFNEFTAVLAGSGASEFDRVLFDTAPTGHTLRLLTLPGAWSGYALEHPSGASCLGPLAGLDRQRLQYEAAVATLADPQLTTLVLVSRPDALSLREAARASEELRELGLANQRLVINGILTETVADPTVQGILAAQAAALAQAPATLASVPVSSIPLHAGDMASVPALQRLVAGEITAAEARSEQPSVRVDLPSLDALVDALDRAGHGVVMTMGKGGVGKTTIAAALALALADRGHDVTLSTTDPAAHLAEALAGAEHERLHVQRIDPAAETARYAASVLDAATELDDDGRALLAEDLRSPCTEEIAVFKSFAQTVEAGGDRIVVLDTAPTGHTLLLLDAAESYRREIERADAGVSDDVRGLAARLRDPDFARILIVTLPEATPISEARRLQDDLRRADIEPYGWIVNSSMQDLVSDSPLLRSRAQAQQRHLDSIAELSPQRTWSIAWQQQAPVGPEALRALTRGVPAAR